MLRLVTMPVAVEPVLWNVVFHPEAATPWLNRLPIGKFKHVSAFTYLPGLKGWLIYDVQLSSTRMVVLPDLDASLDIIARMTEGCEVIAMRRETADASTGRLGFWCVPAIKHLLGLRSSALRPDSLRRDCLRNGGQLIHGCPEIPSAGRSDAAGGSRTSAEGQAACAAIPAER